MLGLNLWISIKISIFVFLVYTLVLTPPGAVIWFVILPLVSRGVLGFFLALLLIHINVWVFLLSAVVIPGLCWKMLNLRYSGTHKLDMKNPQLRNWIVTHMIYIPTAVVLDFFHLYPLKTLHVKLFGGKVGRQVVMGGMITDPSLLEVGDNTTIGGFSMVMGHSVERGKVVFQKVCIGSSCGIGLRSITLPGAVMRNGSLLGAQALLLKNQEIPQGETFGGVPAVNISQSIKGGEN
jgi:acetyltransferase-like isoleucine patch superfamily enzyme